MKYLNCTISPEIQKALEEGSASCIMEVTHKDGKSITFLPLDLCPADDHTLLLSLVQERSRIGEALVYSLWFEKEVRLWASFHDTWVCVTLTPHRIHIVGTQFSHMLQRERTKRCHSDISAVWELRINRWTETAKPQFPPSFDMLTAEKDCHLDLLLAF